MPSTSWASPSPRSVATVASGGTPRCSVAPSTGSTTCRRSASRSSPTTRRRRRWSPRSPRPLAPARSATARSGSPGSTRWSASERGSSITRRSDAPGGGLASAPSAPAGIGEQRAALLADGALVGSSFCRAYTVLLDRWVTDLLGDTGGVALMAVGSYGRAEMCPGSDLDLLLLHTRPRDIAAVADQIWYPIWDAHMKLDHSVRTV